MAKTSSSTTKDRGRRLSGRNGSGAGQSILRPAQANPQSDDGGGGGGPGSPDPGQPTDGIAGMSSLKGLLLYGATLAFVGLYGYFIIKIFGAPRGTPPTFGTTTVGAAAALAGALGSAFALEIGAPTGEQEVNQALGAVASGAPRASRVLARVRRVLSLAPGSTHDASWPKTFGIWAYAAVAGAVAFTYVVNQHETPPAVRALAVAFAGYIVALISAAYKAQQGAS
jgi:hypothetical protein